MSGHYESKSATVAFDALLNTTYFVLGLAAPVLILLALSMFFLLTDPYQFMLNIRDFGRTVVKEVAAVFGV